MAHRIASIPSKPGMVLGIARDAMMTRNTIPTPATGVLILERLPQVKARCSLGRSEIYRRIAAGTFPSPVKLGERASAWNSVEIDNWILARIAARDAKAAA